MVIEFAAKETVKAAIDVAKKYFISKIERDEKIELSKNDISEEGEVSLPIVFKKVKDTDSYRATIGSVTRISVSFDEGYTDQKLSRHISSTVAWASVVNFRDMRHPKEFESVYVDLETNFLRSHEDDYGPSKGPMESRSETIIPIIESCPSHVLITGLPGAGKTTTMKRVILLFHKGISKLNGSYSFPVLIRLRDLTPDPSIQQPIFHFVKEFFSVERRFESLIPEPDGKDTASSQKTLSKIWAIIKKRVSEAEQGLIMDVIREARPLFILDGFDEVSDPKLRESVKRDISWLSKESNGCSAFKIIVTSRIGELDVGNDFKEYQIAALTQEKIELLAQKWLRNEGESDQFLKQLRKVPYYDNATKPLSLAHLCAVYDRTGYIPEKPKHIYRKIVHLLLEEWDRQRFVTRKSRFENFHIDEKFDFLTKVAHFFSVELGKYTVGPKDLEKTFEQLHRQFQFRKDDCIEVFSEIEGHTGLLIRTGKNAYEFSHKSLQEYLAAEHMVKRHKPPDRLEASRLNSELAVAVSISTSPADYLDYLVHNCFLLASLPKEYFLTFLRRLAIEKPSFEDNEIAIYNLMRISSLYWFRGEAPIEAEMQNISDSELPTQEDLRRDPTIPIIRQLMSDSERLEGIRGIEVDWSVRPLESTDKFILIAPSKERQFFPVRRDSLIVPLHTWQELASATPSTK
ncbi:NACHT domain-containing NTPase [Ruegeria sp. HKCCD8929]|uniref:NACHT domain-containing protein n=1 Tax=Ruegeria sp. HKCCD8929 TaxID=2683006 RepID=UPI001489F867|nr:NACHT domain-containing protein [Ruegeria sp. HKCCD8929]